MKPALTVCTLLVYLIFVRVIYGRPIKLNEIQFLGSRNSYHVPPKGEQLDETLPEFRYTQSSLLDQVKVGVRWFNLALHADDSNKIRIYNLNKVDPSSNCDNLRECLEGVASWSKENPNHVPIWIHLSTSNAPEDRFWPELEQQLQDVLGSNNLYTPDMFLGEEEDLTAALTTSNWPALSTVRGKFIVVVTHAALKHNYYNKERPKLKNKLFFPVSGSILPTQATLTSTYDPDVIILHFTPNTSPITGDPDKDVNLKAFVKTKGFLVAYTLDSDLATDGIVRAVEDNMGYFFVSLDDNKDGAMSWDEGLDFVNLMSGVLAGRLSDMSSFLDTLFQSCACLPSAECKTEKNGVSQCSEDREKCSCQVNCCKANCTASDVTPRQSVGYLDALTCGGTLAEQATGLNFAIPSVSVGDAQKRQQTLESYGIHSFNTIYPISVPDAINSYKVIPSPTVRCNPVWNLQGCVNDKLETAEEIDVSIGSSSPNNSNSDDSTGASNNENDQNKEGKNAENGAVKTPTMIAYTSFLALVVSFVASNC